MASIEFLNKINLSARMVSKALNNGETLYIMTNEFISPDSVVSLTNDIETVEEENEQN